MSYGDYAPSLRITAQTVSPCGGFVAHTDGAGGTYNLIIKDVASGESWPVTSYVDRSVRWISWHPSGEWLVFFADHHGDEFFQIFRVNRDGSDLQQITDRPRVQHLIGSATFNPSGTLFAYAANITDSMQSQIWVWDPATGEERELTSERVEKTPAGSWIDDSSLLATYSESNTVKRPALVTTGGDVTQLYPHGEGTTVPICAMPGGGYIVLSDEGRDTTGLALLPEADGTLEWLFTPEWEVKSARVSADGKNLATLVNMGGYSELTMFELPSMTPVVLPEIASGELTDATITADGNAVTVLHSSPTSPVNVTLTKSGAPSARELTNNVPKKAALHNLVDASLVHVTAEDGGRVPLFVYVPPGEGPFPTVVSVHGGPQAQETPRYRPIYQYLLSMGIAVVAPNVRGSIGYGKEYARSIEGRWGDVEMGDFLAVNEYVAAQPWADASRIGIMGASYGGYAVLACLTQQPDKWACGVDIFGPSNLVHLWESCPPTWRRGVTTLIGDPEKDYDSLMDRSPVTHMDKMTAPLFVIQGATDPRVVKKESDQVVESLKARGHDVRYDVYDDEGHGFTRESNEFKAMGDSAEYLAKHLLPTL